MNEAFKAALCEQMRFEGGMMEHAYKSLSGADVAEAEKYRLARLVYVDVFQGLDLEESIAKHDAAWRAYAVAQATKVAAAPKIKRGPSAGHSVISHQWVSPEAFALKAIHIRQMIATLINLHQPSSQR